MRVQPRLTLAAPLAACAICAAAPPAVADEGESVLSLSANYARFSIPDHSPSGGLLGFDYERGVTDVLWARASGGGGVYAGESTNYSGHLTVGLTYVFDVLKYVPYANFGLGAIVIGGGELETDIHPLVEFGAGLDILRSRSFSYGLQIRFETFVQETSFFTAGLRGSWRWGFF